MATEAEFKAAAEAWFQFERDNGCSDFPEQLRAALEAAALTRVLVARDCVREGGSVACGYACGCCRRK